MLAPLWGLLRRLVPRGGARARAVAGAVAELAGAEHGKLERLDVRLYQNELPDKRERGKRREEVERGGEERHKLVLSSDLCRR